MSRIVDIEPLDCLAWKDGEHGTTFDDGVLWVLGKIGELPSVQTCDDAVSRQAAIDEMKEWILDAAYLNDVVKCLRGLPPAYPGVIRCKDCKHRDPEDKKCDCGHDILWQLPRDDDWFCADAKRRKTE